MGKLKEKNANDMPTYVKNLVRGSVGSYSTRVTKNLPFRLIVQLHGVDRGHFCDFLVFNLYVKL